MSGLPVRKMWASLTKSRNFRSAATLFGLIYARRRVMARYFGFSAVFCWRTHEGKMSRSLLITGAIIFLLGIAGVAIPYFTTEQTHNVANVGPLHVQATEQHSHVIPPLLSEAAIAVGLALMGLGLFQRR